VCLPVTNYPNSLINIGKEIRLKYEIYPKSLNFFILSRENYSLRASENQRRAKTSDANPSSMSAGVLEDHKGANRSSLLTLVELQSHQRVSVGGP